MRGRRFRHEAQTPCAAGGVRDGVAVLVASLLVYGVDQGPTPARPATESVVAQRIDKIAEQAAANAGDPNITEVIWVATTASAAAAISGVSMPGTTPVYLVEIPGSFMLKDVSLLPCAPTGRVEFSRDIDPHSRSGHWASGASWTI